MDPKSTTYVEGRARARDRLWTTQETELASNARFSIKAPLQPDGWVLIDISIPDLRAITDSDREFLLGVIEQLMPLIPTPPEIPAVLRGVAGGRA